jgi:hypothetical protein
VKDKEQEARIKEFAREYALEYCKQKEAIGKEKIPAPMAKGIRSHVRRSLAEAYPEEVKAVDAYSQYLSGSREGGRHKSYAPPSGSLAERGWKITAAMGAATRSVNESVRSIQESSEMKDLTNETRVENPNEKINRARRSKEPMDTLLYLIDKRGYLPDTLTIAKLMGTTQADVYAMLTLLKKTHDCEPVRVYQETAEDGKGMSCYVFKYTLRPLPPKSDKEIVQEHIEKLSAQDLKALAELLKGNK